MPCKSIHELLASVIVPGPKLKDLAIYSYTSESIFTFFYPWEVSDSLSISTLKEISWTRKSSSFPGNFREIKLFQEIQEYGKYSNV